MKGKLNLKMYGGKYYLKKDHQIINYHTIIFLMKLTHLHKRMK